MVSLGYYTMAYPPQRVGTEYLGGTSPMPGSMEGNYGVIRNLENGAGFVIEAALTDVLKLCGVGSKRRAHDC